MVFPGAPVTVGFHTEALLKFDTGVHVTELADGEQVTLVTDFCLHNKLIALPVPKAFGSGVTVIETGATVHEPLAPVTE